jgi:CRISPR-associated protein Cmr4
MSAIIYLLCAKTNLHAGSGSTNYGVIDNLVQRDPIDELPCIYASSLKGAFREYFEEEVGIFGPINTGTLAKGSHIFHEALLLSMPVRSSRKAFYSATAPFVLQRFLDRVAMFNIPLSEALKKELERLIKFAPADNLPLVTEAQEVNNLYIEDFDKFSTDGTALSEALHAILGKDIVLMSDADFKEQCSDSCLPIIARNNLENGVSKNLWYEQVVPREARFCFVTSTNETEDLFAKHLGQYVQVGANASIGYGKCSVQSLNQLL